MVDFGPGVGLYSYYDNAAWSRLDLRSPDRMAPADLDGDGLEELVADLGMHGIQVYTAGSGFELLHSSSSELLAAGDLDGNGLDEIVVDFSTGPGLGIYVYYNNSTWSRLHGLGPEAITTANLDGLGGDELIVDFGAGPGLGLWVYYNNGSWFRLHGLSPELMAAGDLDGSGLDDLIVDFGAGPGLGLYVYYNNSIWSRLHSLSPELIAIGELGDCPASQWWPLVTEWHLTLDSAGGFFGGGSRDYSLQDGELSVGYDGVQSCGRQLSDAEMETLYLAASAVDWGTLLASYVPPDNPGCCCDQLEYTLSESLQLCDQTYSVATTWCDQSEFEELLPAALSQFVEQLRDVGDTIADECL